MKAFTSNIQLQIFQNNLAVTNIFLDRLHSNMTLFMQTTALAPPCD